MDTVEQLKKEAREAKAHYEKKHARLYTSDGFTMFPQAEHEERVSALKGKKNRTLRDVEVRAKALREELIEEADLSNQFAPDKALSAGERSEVQSRLPMMQGDVGAQPTEALANQLRSIVRNGSKAEQFAYCQAASKRNRLDRQRQAEGIRPESIRGRGSPH